jgi:hypothetical protein
MRLSSALSFVIFSVNSWIATRMHDPIQEGFALKSDVGGVSALPPECEAVAVPRRQRPDLFWAMPLGFIGAKGRTRGIEAV